MSGTDDTDGRWMTYAELAAARGIDHQSARRLAARLKLQRRKDNVDGTVRVFVPSARAAARRHGGGLSALEAALDLLREQLQAERDRADRAEQGRDAERARADALRDQVDMLRAELAADRARADQADAALREAQERLDALARSAAARPLRGRLARLLSWRRVEW